MNGNDRAVLLRAIAAKLKESADAIAALESRDGGKPLAESKFDVDDAVHCMKII
jgi:betaine-aldehyde dehydrogenase